LTKIKKHAIILMINTRMKKIIYTTIILIIGLFLFVEFKDSIYPGRTMTGTYVKIGDTVIDVEIADEMEERWQGLSNRESLGEESGMLFIFPKKQVQNFWMKDMNFPLDMIWIADDTIMKMDENLPPAGEHPDATYSSVHPVNYVLEVNAGFAAGHGIKAGDRIEYHLKDN